MKWDPKLFVGASLADGWKKIKWKIDHNAGTPGVYVIALASNPQDQLDIIPSFVLMQKGYPKKNLYIIGLAKGRGEAFALVRDIVDETYRAGGNADARAYVTERGKGV